MIQITPHMKILVAEGKTMGQTICFSPLNPLRLGVLSEAGVKY
jgi:hypothetical protein